MPDEFYIVLSSSGQMSFRPARGRLPLRINTGSATMPVIAQRSE